MPNPSQKRERGIRRIQMKKLLFVAAAALALGVSGSAASAA
jgi:hypothetical protein